jgi:hypothetical protein
MLKLVGMCMHSTPGLYGDGEGAIVGPFLLVLLTALAEPRLSFLKVQIMKTIEEFIDLMVVDRSVYLLIAPSLDAQLLSPHGPHC